ncbi:MAG TPA: hypothetical protein VD761_10685 [Solirubrobacterales bacterium]|nr:hypothetical protein [Solirubrobacterales bacterium]
MIRARLPAAPALCSVLVVLLAAALVGAAFAGAEPRGHAGSLIRSYGEGGFALRDFGTQSSWGGAKRMIATPEGGALVLTSHDSIARFDADGALDRSFGEGGFLTMDIRAAQAMAVTPSGKIVTVGSRRTLGKGPRLTQVARYLPDGRPDPSFGEEGAFIFPTKGTGYWGEGVVVEPSGKVIVLSLLNRVVWDHFTGLSVVRLTARGDLDRTYGTGGYATVPAGRTWAGFVDAPLLPRVYTLSDGKLTIALSSENQTLLIRLAADGRLDPSFGNGGKIATNQFRHPVTSLAIDPAGRMLLGSYYGTVARFLPDGTLDPSFGEGGIARHPQFAWASIRVVELTADGKILLGGYARHPSGTGPGGFLLVRLQSSGLPDPSFGAGAGSVTKTLGPDSRDETTDLVQLGDGDILLAGAFTPIGSFDFDSQIGLIRYTADGTLEPSFGAGGAVIARTHAQANDDVADLLAVAGGKTVVVGKGGDGIAVGRYTSSGRPDRSFGRKGFAAPVAVSGDYFGERATSVTSYPGNRFVVGTFSRSGGGLLRYFADGRLDPGFGRDGIAPTAPFDGVLDVVTAPGGELLAVGVVQEGCILRLARFKPDGNLDRSYGGGEGWLRVGNGYGPCRRVPVRLAARRDGSVVVAGGWSSPMVVVSPRGHRNADFGKRGKDDVSYSIPAARTVAIDARGRILVGGIEDKKLTVTRLTPRGFPDRRFGRGGTSSIAVSYSAEALALAIEPDGAIVAAGNSKSCKDAVFCRNTLPVVARFLPSGARDRDFGREGVWRARLGTAANLFGLSLAPGSITAGGWVARPGTARDMALLRLRS